jgi:hypothetical protein
MQRTSGFVTGSLWPGFTEPHPCPPGLHRHLTHDLTALHILSHLLSFGPSPFWLCLISRRLELLRPLLTSRSSVRCRPFRRKARSPQVRTHSFIAQPPDLRRLSFGHKGFAVSCPLALLDSAFYPVLVHRLAIYDPRFLPTFGHPYAVALHFAHCDQLAGGLAPPGMRPCWAHKKKGLSPFRS